jgi:hypothetical protein
MSKSNERMQHTKQMRSLHIQQLAATPWIETKRNCGKGRFQRIGHGSRERNTVEERCQR